MIAVPKRTLWVGCGRLGRRTGAGLVERGGEVFALRREADAAPSGFRAVAADLSEPLDQVLPECDAMVITLPPPDDPAGYEAPLRHLAAALPRLPERTLFVSSTRVFEGYAECADPAPMLTEEDPPQPRSDRARVRLALLVNPDPPRLLHAIDGAPARLGEVVTHIASRLELPVPPAAAPDPGHGTVLDGARMTALLGELRHPDFRSGYDAILDDRTR